jgi:hypothetical protein
MSIIQYNELELKQSITFKTKNASDNHQWIGTITGFVEYSLTNRWAQDLIPYDREVRKVDITLDPVDQLRYIVLNAKTDINLQSNPLGIVAYEWIDLTTLQIIDDQNNLDLRIFDIGTRQVELIDLLRANNFLVRVL